MPLYEYECEECRGKFEELVSSASASVRCPRCGADRVERQLSAFAVGASDKAAAQAGPCGSCGDPRGPGACRLAS